VRAYNFPPQKSSRLQNVPMGLRIVILLITTQALESKHIRNSDVSSLYRSGSLKMIPKDFAKYRLNLPAVDVRWSEGGNELI
jgi:hypothetical protein